MNTAHLRYYFPPRLTALNNKLAHERLALMREHRAKGHAERVLRNLMANRKAA